MCNEYDDCIEEREWVKGKAMRQYRGKTWDGKWVYGWYSEQRICKTDGILCLIHATDKTYAVIRSSVEQSTGECDCNKMEIFDKDWVEASIYGDENPQVLQVHWCKGGYVIDYEDSESDCVLVGEFVGSLRIVRPEGIEVPGWLEEG